MEPQQKKSRLNRLKSYFTDFPKRTGTWPQFLDWKQFSFPQTWSDITRRLPDNLQVFFSNYCCISVVLIVYCLMTSPLLLIAMAVYSLIMYAIYKCDDEVAICGMDPWSRNEQMIIATVVFIPAFCFMGLTGTFFWLVGVITFVVAIHAMFHESLKISAVDQASNTAPMTGVLVASTSKAYTESAPAKSHDSDSGSSEKKAKPEDVEAAKSGDHNDHDDDDNSPPKPDAKPKEPEKSHEEEEQEKEEKLAAAAAAAVEELADEVSTEKKVSKFKIPIKFKRNKKESKDMNTGHQDIKTQDNAAEVIAAVV